jgi:hypothetical protein
MVYKTRVSALAPDNTGNRLVTWPVVGEGKPHMRARTGSVTGHPHP